MSLKSRSLSDFWKSNEFKETYVPSLKSRNLSGGTTPEKDEKRLTARSLTEKSTVSKTISPSFKWNNPVYFNSTTHEYTPDATVGVPIYLVESKEYPGNYLEVFGEDKAIAASNQFGTSYAPLLYDGTGQLYLQSQISPTTQSTTADTANQPSFGMEGVLQTSGMEVAKYFDTSAFKDMTDAEVSKVIQSLQDQGYTFVQYGDLGEELQEQANQLKVTDANRWTASESKKLGAFKKLLPEDWFLLRRGEPSTANEVTIWAQSEDGTKEEPVRLVRTLSGKMLDLTNIPNSTFGIGVDAISAFERGFLGKLRAEDPYADQMLAYTTDTAISILGGAIRSIGRAFGKEYHTALKEQNPDLNWFERVDSIYSSEQGDTLDAIRANWERANKRASDYHTKLINMDIDDLDYLYDSDLSHPITSLSPTRTQIDDAEKRLQIKRNDGIKAQSIYREQALVALNNGDTQSAVDYTKKAQAVDRSLGLSYWENEATDDLTGLSKLYTEKYKNTIGTQYSKLNTGVYEDWTWAIDPEKEQRFLDNLAYAEIQLGRPLTVFEITTIRNKYVDMAISIVGDIGLDPGTYFGLGLVEKFIGPAARTARAAKAAERAGELAGTITPGTKFAEKVFKPILDRLPKITRSQEWVDRAAGVTQGAGRIVSNTDEMSKVLSSPAVRMNILEYLKTSTKKLAVRSGGSKLFQATYEIFIPLADFARNPLKNTLGKTLPEIMSALVDNADSVEKLRGLIRTGQLPVMSDRALEVIVKLHNSVPREQWLDMLEYSEKLVMKEAREGLTSEVRTAIKSPELATKRGKNILKAIESHWEAMLLDPKKVELSAWLSDNRVATEARKLMKKGTYKTLEEAKKAVLAWVNGPELLTILKPIWMEGEIARAAGNASIIGAEDARKIILKFAENFRGTWLNQIGVTKLWAGPHDVTTDTLIATLNRKWPELFTKKIGEDAYAATTTRNVLLTIRGWYQQSLNFIFSAILNGRPGYLMVNWVDSNFRGMINGIMPGDDINSLIQYHTSRSEGLPLDLFQAMNRDFLTDPESIAAEVFQGKFHLAKNPFTNWKNVHVFNLGKAKKAGQLALNEKMEIRAAQRLTQDQSVLAKIANSVDDFTLKAYTMSTSVIKSFLNGNGDFNNLTEIVVRTKGYHRFYLENLETLEPVFLKRALANVPEKHQDFMLKLIKKSSNNPRALREMVNMKDPSVLYSQLIPEPTRKILETIDNPHLTKGVVTQIQEQFSDLYLNYLNDPKTRAKECSKFLDNVEKLYADEFKRRTEWVFHGLRDVSTDSIGNTNISKSLDDLVDATDKAILDERLPDEEIIRLNNLRKNGVNVPNKAKREVLDKQKIPYTKGKEDDAISKEANKIINSKDIKAPDPNVFSSRQANEEAYYDYILSNPLMGEEALDAIKTEKVSRSQAESMLRDIQALGTPEASEAVIKLSRWDQEEGLLVSRLRELFSMHKSVWGWHGVDPSLSQYNSTRFFSWLNNAHVYRYEKSSRMILEAKEALATGKKVVVPEWDIIDELQKLGVTLEWDSTKSYITGWKLSAFDMERPMRFNTENMVQSLREAVLGNGRGLRSDIPDIERFRVGDINLGKEEFGAYVPYKQIPVVKANWTGAELLKTKGVTDLIGAENAVEGLTAGIRRSVVNLDLTSKELREITDDVLVKRIKQSGKKLKVIFYDKLADADTLKDIAKIYEHNINDLFDVVADAGNILVTEGREEFITTLVRGYNKSRPSIFQAIRTGLESKGWSRAGARWYTGLLDATANVLGPLHGISKDEWILRNVAGLTNFDSSLRPLLLMDVSGNVTRHSPLWNRLDKILTESSYKNGKEVAAILRKGGIGEFAADTPEIKWFMDWLEAPEQNSNKFFSQQFRSKFKNSTVRNADGTPELFRHVTSNEYDPHHIRFIPNTPSGEFGIHFGTEAQVSSRNKILSTVNDLTENKKVTREYTAYLVSENPLIIDRDLEAFVPGNIGAYLLESDDPEIVKIGGEIIQKLTDGVLHPWILKDKDEMCRYTGRIVPDVLEAHGYDSIKYINEVEGIPEEVWQKFSIDPIYPSKKEMEIVRNWARENNNYSYIMWDQKQIILGADEISSTADRLTKENISNFIAEAESKMPTPKIGEINITNPNFGEIDNLNLSSIAKTTTSERLSELLPSGIVSEKDLRKILSQSGMDINSPVFEPIIKYYKTKFFGGDLTSDFIVNVVAQRERVLSKIWDNRILDGMQDVLAKEWPELRLTTLNKGGVLMPNGNAYGFSTGLMAGHADEEAAIASRLSENLEGVFENLDMVSPYDFGAVRVTAGKTAGFDITSKMTRNVRDTISDYVSTLKTGDVVQIDYLKGVEQKSKLFTVTDNIDDFKTFLGEVQDFLPPPPNKRNVLNFTGIGDTGASSVLGSTGWLFDGRAYFEILTGSDNALVASHEIAHMVLPQLTNDQFRIFMSWATTTKYRDGVARKLIKNLDDDLVRRGLTRKGTRITSDMTLVGTDRVMTADEFRELFNKCEITHTATKAEQEAYIEIQEAWANGFTKHIYEGNIQSSKLRQVYQRLKDAIADFYNGFIKGTSLDVRLSQEMRDLYSVFTGGFSSGQYKPGESLIEHGKSVYGIPVYAQGEKTLAEGIQVPSIINSKMRQQLHDIGLSNVEINNLTPAQAVEHLTSNANKSVVETTNIFGSGRYYFTDPTSLESVPLIETSINFRKPFVIESEGELEVWVEKFGLEDRYIDPNLVGEARTRRLNKNMDTFKKMLREEGYDGVVVSRGSNSYQILDFKITEEEQAIWHAILNNPSNNLLRFKTGTSGMDLTSAESFLAGCRQRMKAMQAQGEDAVALAWSSIIDNVEEQLRRIPRSGETIKDITISSQLAPELKEGMATAMKTMQYDLAAMEQLGEVIKSWKNEFAASEAKLAKGVEGVSEATISNDAFWEEIRHLIPEVEHEMSSMEDAIIHGGNYAGIDVTGALPRTNEVFLDYTTQYELETIPRLIFPFWQFPTRSVPFWVKTLVLHPEIINFYTKYQLQSYRQRLQGGMVTSNGTPVRSLAGYVRLPGTDYYWNPTAPLSFRLLFPSAYQGFGNDENQNERSMLGSVLNAMSNATKLRGISMNPFLIPLAVKAGWIDDEGQQYSIIPQADLVPRFIQREILTGLRKTVWDSAPELWSPSVSYVDYLIEQMILKDTLTKINEMRESSVIEGDYMDDAYVLTASVAHLFEMSLAERKEDPIWIEYRKKYEKSETQKSWIGYMTGVYGKKYTAADAQFTELRNEINLLRSALNNETQTQLFELADTQLDLLSTYNYKRYDDPSGELWSLYQATRWVTDINGEELTGDQRVEKIRQTVEQNTKNNSYYNELEAIYKRRDEALSALPIGSPSSVRGPIIQKAMDEVVALDTLYGRTLTTEYSVYNKPAEAILNHFESKWWAALTTSKPDWDSTKETYSEYKTRWNEWAENLPVLAQQTGEAFLKAIKPQMDVIYAYDEATSTVSAEQLAAERAAAEQAILKMMQEEGNLEGYIRHQRSNDTATDALLEAWTETYLQKYYDYTEGKSHEEYLLAERKFKSEFPNPPTFEQLAQWVMDTYPQGQFTVKELREAYEDADEDVLSVEERRAQGRSDKEVIREDILNILEIVGPGYNSINFNSTYASPTVGGTDREISDIYNDWEKFSVEELNVILQRMQLAAIITGVREPTSAELVSRTMAREQNDEFKTLTKSILGERFYDNQSWFYSLNYTDQTAYKKSNPEFAAMLEKYTEIKKSYARQYPTWASYYYKETKKEKSDKAPATLTGRSLIPPDKPLTGRSLGSPDVQIKTLEFNQSKSSWPAGMEDAVGALVVDALREKYVRGTALSQNSVTYLEGVASRHPEWAELIRKLISQ